MNIIIFGATGGIGREAVKYAYAKGHQVTAFVRNRGKLDASAYENIKVFEGEISDRNAVRAALCGQDAVIWCVGIPMKRKYSGTASLDGHRILLEEMSAQGIRRLVDWGTPSIPFSQDKRSFITVVPGVLAGIALTAAKKEMIAIGDLVSRSGLDWTIVRFLAPKDGPYTGKVKVGFGDVRMKFSVTRADIAAFMVDTAENGKYVHSMPIIGS